MKMLRAARKSKGLTMKELGGMVGVSESAISQYETGKREADFETLLKIGDALGCSIDYLLRGAGQKEPPTPVARDGQVEKLANALTEIGIDVEGLTEAQIRRIARLSKVALEE